MTGAAPQDPGQTPPWWASLPEVQSSCSSLDASEVAELLEVAQVLENDPAKGVTAKRDFLLVDVRRTDWEGGTIATSINLPAHSFYQTRPVVYRLCKQAGIKTIIFYCGESRMSWQYENMLTGCVVQTGSSNGRGPRCAGWMQDYLNEMGETTTKAVILKGGIKGWQKAYGGKMMEWYDEKFWEEQNKSN